MVLFLPLLSPCCSGVAAYKQGKPFIMPSCCSILTRSSGTVKIFSSLLRARPLPSRVKKAKSLLTLVDEKEKGFFLLRRASPLLDFLCPHQKEGEGLTPPVRFEVGGEGGEKSRAFGLLLISSSSSFPKEGGEREGGSGESSPMSWRHKTP